MARKYRREKTTRPRGRTAITGEPCQDNHEKPGQNSLKFTILSSTGICNPNFRELKTHAYNSRVKKIRWVDVIRVDVSLDNANSRYWC